MPDIVKGSLLMSGERVIMPDIVKGSLLMSREKSHHA